MILRKFITTTLLSLSTAFQSNHHHHLHHISPIYFSGSEKEISQTQPRSINTPTRTQSHHQHIESLLESGNINQAVSELQHQQRQGVDVTSSFHAVIEACCASHADKDRTKKKLKQKSRGEQNDFPLLKIATLLLHSMDEATRTPHAYDILISGHARRGLCDDALKLLSEIETQLEGMAVTTKPNIDINTSPSLTTYQAVLTSLANNGQYDGMMALLTRMRRRGVKPTVYTFNTLMNICAQATPSRWKEALSLLSQCQREPGVTPDLVTYTTAMRACARARKSNKALEILRVIQDMGMELDVYCYTTAMNACANDGAWKTALKLMDEMIQKDISPNQFTYSVAITACGNGGQWSKALELLDKMRSMNMPINTITYNSAISALSKAARLESKQQRRYDYDQNQNTSSSDSSNNSGELWRRALSLIQDMERENVPLDKFTYSSAINTCGAAGRWEEAVGLVKAMKEDGRRENRPNKVTYTSAIVACGNSGEWDAAFSLFKEMKLDGLRPDLVAYNALIAAGMNANKPDEVYDLWMEMCEPNKESISPDIVTLTEVIATLDRSTGKANKQRIDQIFTEAVKRGIILREDSLDKAWELDLSGMSFPVARAACRFIFDRLVNRVRDGEDAEDLNLITGASRMREYVRGILRDELRPSVYCVVPKMEQGTLQVKAKMMMNYINGQDDVN